MCSVGSDLDVARLVILVDLKRFAGKLSSIISTYFSVGGFIWRKLMDALCMGQLVSRTCRCLILYTTRALAFVLEHLELLLGIACTLMHTNLCSMLSNFNCFQQ